MIYAIIGALLIGLSLGIFGSGGSILTVPVLVYLLHHPEKAAIAESLAIVGAIALTSAIPYALARLIDWRAAALFAPLSIAGAYAGAHLSAHVPGSVQLLVFAAVMLLAAVFMWRRATAAARADKAAGSTQSAAPEAPPPSGTRSALALAAQGLAVGLLTGFVGVGGGFLIVPTLVLLARLPMRRAVATSLLLIAINAAVGFAKHHQVVTDLGLPLDWRTIITFIAIGAAGALAGKSIGARLNQATLQRGFALFLAAMALFIAAQRTTTLLTTPPPPTPHTP